jgi:hypothetical protein
MNVGLHTRLAHDFSGASRDRLTRIFELKMSDAE